MAIAPVKQFNFFNPTIIKKERSKNILPNFLKILTRLNKESDLFSMMVINYEA